MLAKLQKCSNVINIETRGKIMELCAQLHDLEISFQRFRSYHSFTVTLWEIQL